MKVNITAIIIAHWLTLYDAEKRRASYIDLFVFYAIPLVGAVIAYLFNLPLDTEHYNSSITFFGIFLALLLNIQVAIFAIFQRNWNKPEDERLLKLQQQKLLERRTLLGELNSNISYLTVFSCVSLLSFLVMYVFEATSGIFSSLAVFIYFHFLLTFLMVIKRSHALFQKEYTEV